MPWVYPSKVNISPNMLNNDIIFLKVTLWRKKFSTQENQEQIKIGIVQFMQLSGMELMTGLVQFLPIIEFNVPATSLKLL